MREGIGAISEPENIMVLSHREKAELLKSYFAFLFAAKENDADSAEQSTHHQ